MTARATTLDTGQTATDTPSRTSTVARVPAVDILRGLVIVLMVLDHVRDFFTVARFDPLDPAQSTPALFLTRWVTHYCAPIFVLLAGMSARLLAARTTRAALSAFLLKRGLWLILLEFTLVTYAWSFQVDYPWGVLMQVIWAIGASMVVMAALVHLPLSAIAAIAIALIVGHNLLDPIAPERFGDWAVLWNLLHVPGRIPIGYVAYPLLPWLGVMAIGYVLGGVYSLQPARRQRTLIALGVVAIGLFVLLRGINGYGDPTPWTAQRNGLWTLLAFVDVQKYPPSLMFVLMTVGPGLLLLAALEYARGVPARVLETFGRVPLFAYVLHIAFAHALAGLVALAQGHGTTVLFGFFFDFPPTWGFGLGGVYLAWLVVLALLYPLCHWFAALKRRRSDWWLPYL